MHMKTMLPYNNNQPGFKGHQWRAFCVVLFSMEPSTLLQNIEWKDSEIKEWQSVEVPTAKL